MINCLFPKPDVRLACPPDSAGALDCDGDGHFGLEDVFCCARAMLGGGRPEPGTDSLRAEPGVALRFGLPREVGDGTLEVPLDLASLEGAHVAAARIDIAYPDARYEVVGVVFDPIASTWWRLVDSAPGRVRLALLDLSGLAYDPPAMAGHPGTALLRLRLRPGATAGGELSIAEHDFAAGDGVTITTPNADARLELGPIGRVALSAPRPNPFAASTTLALTLPVAGAVDVGVYNAAGRRVATLLRDSGAAAGVYMLGWNGTDEGGRRAVGGVYFVRVVTGAGDTARKLLFLPGTAR
jgi:hypothetical protein